MVMKWFKRWVSQRGNMLGADKVATIGSERGPSQEGSISGQNIQFRVFSAQGGRVIETQRYDSHRDRHMTGLYIVTNEQEFGKEIDKIITMESLK